MKYFQQDDIQDSFNEPRSKFRFKHIPSGKIVRAETKGLAVLKFKESYNILAKRNEITNIIR